MSSIYPTATERAAIYQAHKVDRLRSEIATCRQGVQQGYGEALVPLFEVTMSEWLKILEADLAEAEAILENLNNERGAIQ
jgi:hypothetical protein